VTPTSLEDGRRLLGASVLFRKLASRERNELVARAHMCRFEAGDTIFLTGALDNSMMAILKGNVKISVSSADGKEIMLARRGGIWGNCDARRQTAKRRRQGPHSL
jgi:CRP/FNR family cyclic AMP-dependent transcriptional regulator